MFFFLSRVPYSIRTYHFYFLQRPVCIPVLNNFSSFNNHFLVTHIQPMLVNAFSTTPPAALFQLRDTLSLLSHPTGNVLSQAKQDLYFFLLNRYRYTFDSSKYPLTYETRFRVAIFFVFFFFFFSEEIAYVSHVDIGTITNHIDRVA